MTRQPPDVKQRSKPTQMNSHIERPLPQNGVGNRLPWLWRHHSAGLSFRHNAKAAGSEGSPPPDV